VGFAALHFLSKKRQYDGQIALGYAAWYGLGRAMIEGLRTDSLYWGPFRVSQVLAAVSCVAAVAILLWQQFRPHDPKDLFVNRVAAIEAETTLEQPPEETENATLGTTCDTAFLEMAEASGMTLLSPAERNPMKTSTFGTGEMIVEVLKRGIKNIIIGIGGSATVDGGTGMAEALGYKFYDKNGNRLSSLCGGMLQKIARIDTSAVDSRLEECKIRIASDVTNPLLGDNGAVAVFAPQNGATPEMMPILEEGLANLRRVLKQQNLITEDLPGDGAAGGLGLGLRAFCNAVPESGASLAIAATFLEEKLENADYLITGEGCSDSQTDNGKLCAVVAQTCKKHGVPCILLSGKVLGENFHAFDKVCATVPADMPFEKIKPHAEELLRAAAVRLANSLNQ
jgi:glycerate kinase